MADVEDLIEGLQDVGYDNHVLSAVIYGPQHLECHATQDEFNAAAEALQESDAVIGHITALRTLMTKEVLRRRNGEDSQGNPYRGDARYEEIKDWTILDFDLEWANKPEAATLTFAQYVDWVLADEEKVLEAVGKALDPLGIFIEHVPPPRLDVDTLEDHFKDVDELTLEELEAAEPNPDGPFYDYGAARFFAQWFADNADGRWHRIVANSLPLEALTDLYFVLPDLMQRRFEEMHNSAPDHSVAGGA